jgi:uncharacterized repeat protein (TIGR01451 family)
MMNSKNKNSEKERRVMCMKILSSQKFLVLIFFLTGFFLLAGPSQAQQSSAKLDLKTMAEKEVKVTKEGKSTTKRIPLDKASPGNIVVYTITYSNVGKGPILDAKIVDPVPAGVRYIADTAEGKDAEITFSIDNGRTWLKPPVMIEFRKPDGSLEKKTAPPDMYTHIKWAIKRPVAPGQSGQVSFKVTVK